MDEVVAFHMDAVKADVADFAFELADVFDTAAQVAAEAFDLAGGEADFQELVGDGVAVCQIIGVAAVVFFQLFDHLAVFAFDEGEVFQHFLLQFGKMRGRHGFGVAAGIVVIVVFIRFIFFTAAGIVVV